jgi:hypothetical protein
MSFLSDVGNFFKDNPVAGSFATIVGLALLSKQISKNLSPANADVPNQPETGTRQQLRASTKNNINVLYGDAYTSGPLTDAKMSDDTKTMYYCLTLSEKTGTKLSDGQASQYTFKEIYWNGGRIVFQDGVITASYTIDKAGNVDRSINGLVEVYCYAGNSSTPKIPEGYTNTSTSNAFTIMPGWTQANQPMSDLVFAIVKVTYSSSNNVTGLADMTFRISNTMMLPGDVIYDYMSSTRYGAGIPTAEILSA